MTARFFVFNGLLASACAAGGSGSSTPAGSSDLLAGGETHDADATGADGTATDATTADAALEQPDFPPPKDVPLAGAPAEGALRVSYISADSYDDGQTLTMSVVVGFYDMDPAPGETDIEQIGPCAVTTTTFGDGGFPRYIDAGTIGVAGGTFPVTVKRLPTGYYENIQEPKSLWEGGELLTFAGSGAAIPAFSATLTAPTQLEIGAPILPIGAALPVSRTKDLAFSWTGSTAGEVVVDLAGPQQLPSPQTTIRCRFAGAAGAGTIPAAALEKITLTGTGTISVTAESAAAPVAGDWGPVHVTAVARALTPSHRPYSGTIDLE